MESTDLSGTSLRSTSLSESALSDTALDGPVCPRCHGTGLADDAVPSARDLTRRQQYGIEAHLCPECRGLGRK